MTSSRSALVLACLFASVALAVPKPPDAERVKADEETLQAVGLDVDGAALLTFFRNRTPSEKDRKLIETLIRDLGSDRFPVREKASQQLLSLGPPAVSALKDALESRDLEVVCRAKRCLAVIEKAMAPDLMCAAARLLAHRKPGGAAKVLLDYLPAADSDAVVEEVRSALVSIGFPDNKPAAEILEALKDEDDRTRAVAAEALILSDAPGAREAARALIKDPSADVRLAVALALVGKKDKTAVEPLIDLIPKLEDDQAWKVEDVLHGIAGDKAPEAGAVGAEPDRKQMREAWSKWWKDNGDRIDLAKIDPASFGRGLTLISTQDARAVGVGVAGLVGRVMEVGKDGKVRWEIKNLSQPMGASIVGPDRVLIVEYRARKATERNFKGEVVWEYASNTYVIAAERLPNGNNLVVTRNSVVEVDRTGKEVNTWTGKNGLLYAARRAKNGEVVVMDRTGFTIFDATGKEAKRVTVPAIRTTVVGMSIDVLPNGNVLFPSYPENKVYEYDRDGKKVSEMAATQPTGVQRLANGNTLISSRYANVVAEYDKSGKMIWEHKVPDGTIIHARRR